VKELAQLATHRLRIDWSGIHDIAYWNSPGRGIPLLYLHGLGGSKVDLAACVQQSFLASRSIWALDFPGMGETLYSPNNSLSMYDLVEITHSFVKQVALPRFILAGHSMGGIVGLLFARKYPELVGCFLNVEGNLSPEDCFFTKKALNMRQLGREREYLLEFRQSMLDSDEPGFASYGANLSKNVRSFHAWYDYCHSIVDCSDNAKLMETFQTLPVARFFVYGQESRGLAYIPDLQRCGIGTWAVPGSSHFPHFSNPEAYAHLLAQLPGDVQDSLK